MTSVAYAAGTGAGGAGGLASFLPLILIFVVFYFLLIRPQQKQAKQHKQFLNDLKSGDKIITRGGIHGTITGLTDTVITVEIAKDMRIKLSRDAVSGGADSAAAPQKDGKKAGS